ncbi:MAG: hypothetical protein HY053_09010 [Proteobacteria bacterium]|nr:hypothetical protein [Pseudomonadota bacterium]
MNFYDRRFDDYLLPDSDSLEELSIFDENMPCERTEPDAGHEEWPQI